MKRKNIYIIPSLGYGGAESFLLRLIPYMKYENIIITLFNTKYDKNRLKNIKVKYITLDPFVDNLKDANGAGDALLAYSSAALFKEKSLIMASIIGILVASCKCEKKGNLPLKISINWISGVPRLTLSLTSAVSLKPIVSI